MSEPRLLAAAERLRGRPGRPRKAPRANDASSPLLQPQDRRLLSLAGAAAYLSCSTWTIRDLGAAGVLKRVRIPLPNGGELRKVLYDREDLDQLITKWKEAD
jgi:hypothetical protein